MIDIVIDIVIDIINDVIVDIDVLRYYSIDINEVGCCCQWMSLLWRVVILIAMFIITRSERDLRSCEVTWAVTNKAQNFTTAKISFTSILYPQFIHMIFVIYTSLLLLPLS